MKKILSILVFVLVGVSAIGQTVSNVPFLKQQRSGCGTDGWKTGFCGHTSSEMLFAFHEKRTPVFANVEEYNRLIENQFHSGYHDACGTGTPDPQHLVWLAKHFGYTAATGYGSSSTMGTFTENDLKNELASGFPVIIQVHTSMNLANGTHWMLLVGMNDTHITVNDPGKTLGEYYSYTISEFRINWNSTNRRCVTMRPKNLINSNVEIYAGTYSNPRQGVTISVSSENLPSVFAPYDFKVDGYSKTVPVSNCRKSGNKAKFEINFPTVSSNKTYDFSFKINNINGTPITYYGKDIIYYINENGLNDVVDNSAQLTKYIKQGIRYGLFKGSYNETTANYWFYPNGNLTRGQFCKVIVSAAVNLGYFDIDTRTTVNGTFSDCTSSEYYPYIQTLRNEGYIQAATNFRPNDNIKAGEMAKIVKNVFGLSNADKNSTQLKPGQYVNSQIQIQNSSSDIYEAMDILRNIIVRVEEDGVIKYEPISAGLTYPTLSTIAAGQMVVTGENTVKRDIMAKMLTKVYEYKKGLNVAHAPALRAQSSSTSELSNTTIVGDKFETTSNVTGSNVPAHNLGNIILQRGDIRTWDLSSIYGSNYFCYWTVSGGTLEDLASNNAHKKVKYTAPSNISSTQVYDLYLFVGSVTGKYNEFTGTITVQVNGSTNITHLDAPSGLYVGSINPYSFKVYWNNVDWDKVTRYVIQSATNSSFTQNVQEDIKTGGDAERVVSRDRGTYYIRIKAVNTALNLESAWSNTLVYNFDPDVPLWISREDLSPTDNTQLTSNGVTLSWTAKGGRSPIKYNLYFSDWNPYGNAPVLANSTATSYTVNNLNYNTDYYWGVTATDADGKEAKVYPVFSFTTAASTTPPTGSITINYGDATTNNPLVNLQISAQATGGKIEQMQLSNDGTNWTEWRYFASHTAWRLDEFGGTTAPGQKTVYVKFKDNSNNVSAVYSDNITLENTAPGYFYVRDLKTPSLRTAIEYAQAGDNIYASAGYFNLTAEIYGTTGATLKQGINLIGEGIGKTTLCWEFYGTGTYYGLILEGVNVVEGLTIIGANEATAQSTGICIGIIGAYDCTIKNCEIKNSNRAFEIRSNSSNGNISTNITIQNCIFHDNQVRTIHVVEANNLNIFNNTIFNNNISSVSISGGNNIAVKNNIVYNNKNQAIYISKDYITNLTFTNNNVWNNCTSNGVVVNYFDLPDQTGINGNISVNPQLDNNQKLLSGSPCINAGINVGLPYAGSAPDMGAFETGLSTGSLTVNSNIAANFVISKPDGSSATIASSQTINNLAQGIYGIYPQQVAGYNLPNPQIISVLQGSNSLQINYTADTQAPEGRIYLNAGDFFTHSRYISIYNDITDKVNGLGNGAKMQFSNNGTTWSAQEPLANKKLLWDLNGYGGNLNAGNKVIYAKFCDAGGNWSGIITDTIQYIPNGRIRVIKPTVIGSSYPLRDNLQDAVDGDVMFLLPGLHISNTINNPTLKFQGMGAQSHLYGFYLRKSAKIDNVSFSDDYYIALSNGQKFTITNIISYSDPINLSSGCNLLLANSVLKDNVVSSGDDNVIYVSNKDMINCYNNVIIGTNNSVFNDEYNYGLSLSTNQNANITSLIRNNIFMNFSADEYKGAIRIQKNPLGQNKGDVSIQNNDFYNNKVDLLCTQNIVENEQPYHIAPDFLSDGSYKLQPNSPLRNLGSDNIIHRNHDGSKNTLGIEGGLFYNTVPTARAEILQQNGKVILNASASYDAQTPNEYLQYRWDYNNDGVFDTEFLLSPTHTVNSITELGDTIVAWVFDEHFSMNYVKIPKTAVVIVPDPASLSLSVSGNSFCAGASVAVQPASVGEFESDNLFAVELSDASGSFANPQTLDYIYGQTIDNSEITVTLPGDLAQGNYKLRLSSSNPRIQGDESAAFSVSVSATPEITITSNKQEICEGTSVIFGATTQNAGSAKTYKWYVNDELAVSGNLPAFSSNALKDGAVVKAELTCTSGCFFPSTVVSNEISIRVNALQTPYVELFPSYYENPQAGEMIDFFAFVENGGGNISYEWYENGVAVSGSESYHSFAYLAGKTIKVKVLCSGDCLSTTAAEAEYVFDDVSGIKMIEAGKISIYPNPVKNELFVKSDTPIEKVKIYSLSGKLLMENNFGEKISVSTLPQGVYLLKVYTDKGMAISKIVKEE